MKNFYRIDENNIVIGNVQLNDEDLFDENNNLLIELGIIFCKKTHGYNTNWVFSEENVLLGDKFIPHRFIAVQPYPSWKFDEEKEIWVNPIPMPKLTQEQKDSNLIYIWDENNLIWNLVDENILKSNMM